MAESTVMDWYFAFVGFIMFMSGMCFGYVAGQISRR